MQENIEILGPKIANLDYHLIDVNRYSYEELSNISNVIAAVFMLDQKFSAREIDARLNSVFQAIRQMNTNQIQKFSAWAKDFVSDTVMREGVITMLHAKENLDKEEVISMPRGLTEACRELRAEGYSKGLEDGELRGTKIGKEIGKELGKEIGKELGKEEREKEIALEALKAGSSEEYVAKITNIPLAKVIELRKTIVC